MKDREKVVGIIGGMGPEATVDFMRRLIAAVPAKDDCDHLHVIADNNSKVPSRIAALIEGHGKDPAPVLVGMARRLEAAGADILTIPCNTAHHYHKKIARSVHVPVIDMVALSVKRLASLSPRPRRIGMLASMAVRKVGVYDHPLAEQNFEPLYGGAQTEAALLELIRAVKSSGATAALAKSYKAVAQTLADQGADALLVACTELSLFPAPSVGLPVVDALDVLVEETVRAARAQPQSRGSKQ